MPNISNLVKSIQDIMRKDAGTYGDAQRIEQMAWLFFLKIFDDRETQLELFDDHYQSPLKAPLRWRNWAADEEGITGDALLDFVNLTLLPALKDLTAGQDTIAGLIRMTFQDANNYMKNGTLMRQVVNKVNGIDFNASGDRHLFGDIYEKILKDLQSAGNAGEFYTPRAVTQFIVEQVDPRLSETVFDPACGTGGFLTCAIDHLADQAKDDKDRETLQSCFAGIEKKHLPHVLCMTNLMLHGIDVPSSVRHGNTLARPLTDWKPREYVDCIVTNPPFGGIEEDGIEANFPGEFRTRETADLFHKGKPIRIEEFQPEKDWWGQPDKSGHYTQRQETEQAWRVSIEDIRANNYNLDIKNPHQAAEDQRSVEELLPEYEKLLEQITETRNALKEELYTALSSGVSKDEG